ncbi:MAG: hypothetical protein SFX19_03765 [Alphaproteobacteria bacterium]|nr:hypothetical protein [Alphaproteobacteria bacterium]
MSNDKQNNQQNFDNIDFIRFLNRIILEEAFKMITEGLPCDNKITPGNQQDAQKANDPKWSVEERERNAQRNILIHRHMRMWGKDKPATDTLGDIADTELKIEKYRPSQPERQPNKPPPLDERERELFRELLRREDYDA